MPELADFEGLLEIIEIAQAPEEAPELLALGLHVLPPPNQRRKGHKRHLFFVERTVAERFGRLLLQKSREFPSNTSS